MRLGRAGDGQFQCLEEDFARAAALGRIGMVFGKFVQVAARLQEDVGQLQSVPAQAIDQKVIEVVANATSVVSDETDVVWDDGGNDGQ